MIYVDNTAWNAYQISNFVIIEFVCATFSYYLIQKQSAEYTWRVKITLSIGVAVV